MKYKWKLKHYLPQEYMKLVRWFSERDWKAWDREIIEDSQSGKLDFLLEEALNAKKNGQLNTMGRGILVRLLQCRLKS